MPCIQYERKKLTPSILEKIDHANTIIAEYEAQGYDLTLRQLFYQFVSRALIANTQREYKNLGSAVNDGRLAGLIDWLAIVDRTRELRALPHWGHPVEIVETCAQQFNYDLWAEQPAYVEVWIEKDALVGVIEGVCNKYDVPHFSCRGYTSQSEMWVAAQRLIRRAGSRDRTATILHLGDHDPSGMDMTRDIRERLELFCGADCAIEVWRLALNPDQVAEYDPPPNPAKLTDSRATEYISRFGDESWELDALDPKVITEIVESNITKRINKKLWKAATTRQKETRDQLAGVAENWDGVVAYVDGTRDE